MEKHSFAFENYARGFPASVLDAELMMRLFGDGVCEQALSPCVLTPRARSWMNEANASMNGGRCEGFAVLSLLFGSGDVDVSEFGALTARSLTLNDNPNLQRELAYWFATQMVSTVVTKNTKTFMAKDVMPFLATALRDPNELYRIGIVKKTGRAVTGGHSLTPLGYFQDPKTGVYFVRIYDNNNPDAERLLKIDTKNNRWEYEAARNPSSKSSLYFGDSTNNNPLYFAPVRNRLGQLPCPFCDKTGGTQVVTRGGVQALVTTSDGKTAGVSEGTFDGAGGSVSPTFSADLDTEPSSFTIEVDDSSAVSISLNGPDQADEGGAQALKAFGPNYVVGLSGLQIGSESTDTLVVSEGAASVRYSNESKTPMGLSTLVELANGGSLEVTTTVDRSDSVGTTIDPMTGAIAVTTQGAAGTPVTVTVTQTSDDGTTRQAQLTYEGSDAGTLSVSTADWAPDGGALSATVDNGAGPVPVTDACLDGVKSGLETDIDCGHVCDRRCGLGSRCVAAIDCVSGLCHATTHRCVADACADGVLAGTETDVDCGGDTCQLCANAKACARDADCQSSACRSGLCVATYSVGLSVSGLPPGNTVTLQNNGVDDLAVQGDGSYQFPSRVTGAYAVTVQQQPPQASCTVTNGSGTATADVSNVSVTCVRHYFISGTVTGLPTGSSVTLQNNSGASTVTVMTDGAFAFSSPTEGPFNVTVVTQPSGGSCAVSNGVGTATGDVANVIVTCVTGFSVGGSVTGLPTGQTLTLANNGIDSLVLSANGTFSFAQPVIAYAVTVQTQPSGATCAVTQGSGNASAAVTNVVVTCLASGSLDLTFGNNGFVRYQPNPFDSLWLAGLINPDDSTIWVGMNSVVQGSDSDWLISKLAPDGALDPSFGTAGHLTVGRGAGFNEAAKAVKVDAQGRYLVGGTVFIAGNYDFGVVRVTSAGTLDPTYGTAGWATANLGANEIAEDMVLLPDGSALVIGHDGGDMVLCKFTPAGAVDTSWGTSGWTRVGSPAVTEEAYSAIADSAGNLYLGGLTNNVATLVKLLPSGALDASFQGGGILVDDLSGSSLVSGHYKLFFDLSGRIIAAGYMGYVGSTAGTVVRYSTAGIRDSTFGTLGVATLDRPSRNDLFRSGLILSDGSMLVGGSSGLLGSVWKVDGTGAISTLFGTNGYFESQFGGSTSVVVRSVLRQSSGRFIVGGYFGLVYEAVGCARLNP